MLKELRYKSMEIRIATRRKLIEIRQQRIIEGTSCTRVKVQILVGQAVATEAVTAIIVKRKTVKIINRKRTMPSYLRKRNTLTFLLYS